MNNKVILAIGIVIIVLAGGYVWMKNASPQQTPQTQSSPASSQATNGKNEVVIKNFAFSQSTITIKVGESITWTNQDNAGHSATADDSSFDTGVLSFGESKTITFTKAGTFTYHCSVHPNMKATVVVQ